MKKILFAFAVIVGVCVSARADNNCTGATYYDSDTDTCIACPAGYDYNQDAGKTNITQCQIHCDAGTYVTGEYTQLEYIETSGTQWIDTSVGFNSNIGYEFEYQPITTNNFVTQAGTGQVIAQSGNVWEFRFNGGNNRRPNPATIDLTKFVNIKYNINNKCSVDDKIVDISDLTLNNAGSIRLFGPDYKSSGRMKFFKVYDNGVLIRDMIPVRRNSDGAIGMYDTITGTFFMNSGTGTFIAGSDAGAIGGECVNVGAGYYAPASIVNYGSIGTRTACPTGTSTNGADNASECTPCAGATYSDETGMAACKSCPARYDYNQDTGKTNITQCQIHCDAGTYVTGEYTQLEYIETSGTQWIDTSVGFNSNIGYEFEYQPITTNNWVTQTGTTGQVIAQLGNVWEFRINGNYNRRPNLATIDLTKFVNIKYNIDNKCSVDDKIVDISDLTLNNAGSIRLFGPDYNSSGRMKFFKVYDNGVLIRDMIPVRRNSDGVIGMYDTITGTFFTNAGTGTFVAGLDVSVIGNECVNVGAGYYAPASTMNYGSAGNTRTACPVGLYTVGYGHGADDANDCGRILHIGDNVIHMRRNKETTPSVNIKMDNGDMFYISLSPTDHTVSRLHFQYNGNEYTAYDDSLFYGERDFDTGQQISQ